MLALADLGLDQQPRHATLVNSSSEVHNVRFVLKILTLELFYARLCRQRRLGGFYATLCREKKKGQCYGFALLFPSRVPILSTEAVVKTNAGLLHRGRPRHRRRGGETSLYPSLSLLSLLVGNMLFFLWHIRRMLRLFWRMPNGHSNTKLAKRQPVRIRGFEAFMILPESPEPHSSCQSGHCRIA